MRNAEKRKHFAGGEMLVWLELDGEGRSNVDSGLKILDDMLSLMIAQANFDLVVKNSGKYSNQYKIAEAVGKGLGEAYAESLSGGDRIKGNGSTIFPVEDALIMTAVDLSGQGVLSYDLKFPTEKVEDFDTETMEIFLLSFVKAAGLTLHIYQISGHNSYTVLIGAFRSLAQTLQTASEQIPATADRVERQGNDSTEEKKSLGLENTLLPEEMQRKETAEEEERDNSSNEIEKELRKRGLL